MELRIKRYDELSLNELYEILSARMKVFIVEQNCPYQDIDNHDENAIHLYYIENNKILAYLRILPKNEYYDEIAIGRVITVERGKGLGLKLLKEAIYYIKNTMGGKNVKIGAQLYAKGFYEKVGFKQSSPIYLEDGIEHIHMEVEL